MQNRIISPALAKKYAKPRSAISSSAGGSSLAKPRYTKMAMELSDVPPSLVESSTFTGYMPEMDDYYVNNKNLMFPLTDDSINGNPRACMFYHNTSGDINARCNIATYNGSTVVTGTVAEINAAEKIHLVVPFMNDKNKFFVFLHDTSANGYLMYQVVFPASGTGAATITALNGGAVISELGDISHDWEGQSLQYIWAEDDTKLIVTFWQLSVTTNAFRAVLFDASGAVVDDATVNGNGTTSTKNPWLSALGYDAARDTYVFLCLGPANQYRQYVAFSLSGDTLTINRDGNGIGAPVSHGYVQYLEDGVFYAYSRDGLTTYSPMMVEITSSSADENKGAPGSQLDGENTTGTALNPAVSRIMPADPRNVYDCPRVSVTLGSSNVPVLSIDGLGWGNGVAQEFKQSAVIDLGYGCFDPDNPSLFWFFGSNAGTMTVWLKDVS